MSFTPKARARSPPLVQRADGVDQPFGITRAFQEITRFFEGGEILVVVSLKLALAGF
jgi:hypothetical protein